MIGSKDDESYIKRLFKNKPDNLVWLGRLPFDETLRWFDQAAFFINTSFHDVEGFPNTFIQAWLRGVPVITLGVDPDGVIKRYNLGFIAKNAKDAMSYLDYLTNNKDVYKKISEDAVRHANKNYSISAAADNFLTILAN
jgi:glycosyltransferase involved in cell wall biosynthesis